jgi:hypothetical protein
MGLKTIVREELKLRGKVWTKSAPQAPPNPKEATRLARRQRGFEALNKGGSFAERYTMPGSYRA